MTVTENIYKIMQEKSLIQAGVAKKAGYTPKLFNNMLRGRKLILADDVLKICKALDVTPNKLFGYGESA